MKIENKIEQLSPGNPQLDLLVTEMQVLNPKFKVTMDPEIQEMQGIEMFSWAPIEQFLWGLEIDGWMKNLDTGFVTVITPDGHYDFKMTVEEWKELYIPWLISTIELHEKES